MNGAETNLEAYRV